METIQLTLPAFGKLELGRTTLDLPPGLEFKDWKELGRRLGELRQSAMFWVGDWWIYGEHAYGDRRALVEADDWQGPSFETCKNAGSVCRAFSERSRRRDRLTFSHHAAVAALPPEQQNRLLDWAEETIAATGKPRPVSQLREFARRQKLSGGLIGNVLPPGALPVGEAKPLLSEFSLAVIEAIGKQPSPPPAGGEPQPLTPVVVQENSTAAHDIAAGKRARAVGCACRAGGPRRRKAAADGRDHCAAVHGAGGAVTACAGRAGPCGRDISERSVELRYVERREPTRLAGRRPWSVDGGKGERCYGAGGEDGNFVAYINRWSAAMPQPNDLSRSLVALDQDSTIIAVVEMSQSSWLVGGVLPGIERQPRKKLEPSPERLLALLHRWRDELVRAGRTITRIALAFEAGRDGFWLARWLEARGVEAHVIHPSSVAVSREHRRAKTDRLDTELLKRGFLGWLRGERGHCSMVRVPTIAEEDAKRPNRERECLVRERTRLVNRMKGALARLGIRNFRPTLRKAAEHLAALSTPEGSPLPPNVAAELERDIARLGLVTGQIKQIEEGRRQRLEEQPERGPHAMVRLLARVVGIGIETADMLVNEVLSRPLRDRRAVARYAGLTGAPDESGAKRREQGLAKAGNARVRRGMIQLAWRFLRFQKNSALAQWYQARTADRRGATCKTMIVALARKLLIALWRFVTIGEPLDGVTLRPAS